MNTIGIALISFGVGLIISWKLAERDIKNAKKKTKNRELENGRIFSQRSISDDYRIRQRMQGTRKAENNGERNIFK